MKNKYLNMLVICLCLWVSVRFDTLPQLLVFLNRLYESQRTEAKIIVSSWYEQNIASWYLIYPDCSK